jgi:hypothetical protein
LGGGPSQAQTPQASSQRLSALQATEADREREGSRRRSRRESLNHECLADEEAAAIATERIKSGAVNHKEDGTKALERLGIVIPLRGFEPRFPD